MMDVDPQLLWRKIQEQLPLELAPVCDGAISHAREILKVFPNASSVKVLLADMLLFSEDKSGSFVQEAQILLQEVIRIDPFCIAAFGSLAAVESRLGNDGDAFDSARFAMELACNIESIVTAMEYGLYDETATTELIEMTDVAAEVFKKLLLRIQSIERQLGVRIAYHSSHVS